MEDAFFDAGEGAGAVAFECEEVFAGPEDRLDPLLDRRQVRSLAGFVFAPRADDRGVEFADGLGECAAGVALVAEQGFAAGSVAAGEQLEADFTLVAFGRAEFERSGSTVGSEDRVQPETPEVAGCDAHQP